MERGLRTVNRQIAELVAAGHLKSERHGHVNHYILWDLAGNVAYRGHSVEKPASSAAVGASDTPNWRIAPTPISITEIEEPENLEQSAYHQHCWGNNVAGEHMFKQDFGVSCHEQKSSPESESRNPEPGSCGSDSQALDPEVAEIREALKARRLVRYTPTFDAVIREMLGSGITVEVIKRAILRGCWLKLACRDRGDTSLIFSMRYFLNVITDVKPMADPAYWRNFEKRLGREEQKRLRVGNTLVARGRAASGRGERRRLKMLAETLVPTVADIQGQLGTLAARKGFGGASRRA